MISDDDSSTNSTPSLNVSASTGAVAIGDSTGSVVIYNISCVPDEVARRYALLSSELSFDAEAICRDYLETIQAYHQYYPVPTKNRYSLIHLTFP